MLKVKGIGVWLGRLVAFLSGMLGDRDALIEVLRESEKRNLFDHDALVMIEGALQVSEMQVRDIMVSRVQMIVVKNNAEPIDILTTVVESGHSRFPVIGDETDEITGILLAKDLLSYFATSDNESFNIKDLMRSAIFVPESKRLNVLLREFRTSRNHMAIVIDEYSGVAGLVTIEDVIEEIIGEIEDEHDTEEEKVNIRQHDHNRFTVNSLTPIDEFNNYFHTDYSDNEYDTIGGLILKEFGHLPKRGETLDFGDYNVTILRAGKKRIKLLRLSRIEQTSIDEEEKE